MGLRLTWVLWMWACAVGLSAQNLYINEIQVANIDQFLDPSFNYGGWIELYNPGEKAVSLSNYLIRHTDQEGNIDEVALKTTHGNVPARGYKVLWFDHNTSQGFFGPNAGNQIPFKLDADGGVLELISPSETRLDAVDYPACVARCSWVRTQDGEEKWGWTTQPTPERTNNHCPITTERLNAPVVSSTGGVFRQNYELQVSIPQGCQLYYTTDGSRPQVGQSAVSPEGLFRGTETTIYRFMLACEGMMSSPVVTRSFIKSQGDFSLPVLSVSTAPAHLFDDQIGLYVMGTNGRVANNSKVKANQNMDWERPVNVEYFVPDAGGSYTEAINQEANFAIFGGWTRFNEGNEDFEYRSSFKLKSDKVFEGENAFAYPLFESKPHIKIKNFLVRNGGQDRDARIWDGAIQELLRTSGVYLDCQAWQPAHVFLDGKYLGMMNLREESNKQFAFSNYGIDKDEMDQWEGDIVIKEGDKKKLDEWYNLSRRLVSNPNDTATWRQICELVDIDEYCNYMAAETYMGNQDWLRGGLKNLKGFRAKDDNGRFHIVLHDVDGGFGDTDMLLQVLEKGTGTMPMRFKYMLNYEPFKKQFIDAYCLMDGSVFHPERCEPIILAMRNTVNPALRLEGKTASNKAQQLINNIGDSDVRRPALKQSLKKAFSLEGEYAVRLASNVAEARLLLNGQEVPTGRFDGYLFPPIQLTASAPEGWAFQAWQVNGEVASEDSIFCLSDSYQPDSLTVEALYERVATRIPRIRINEVSAGNDIYINEYGKKVDWVELYNPTNEAFDLAGAYLTDDPTDLHKFQITDRDGVSTIIPAHGFRLVWCDDKDAQSQMHASFKLKNSNDAFIALTDANDRWTDSLRYQEQPRWQTYGRYPDGGNSVGLLERPTIETPNHLCTTTLLTAVCEMADGITQPVADHSNRKIVELEYYNLGGERLTRLEGEHIVIQHIIYSDGSSTSRKLMRR